MKTSMPAVYLVVSALMACSAQGGSSLPTPTSDVPSGGGANCSAVCARIASTSGCTSMPNCEANCMNAASQVPAQCRASYDSFLSCASSSQVACSGGNPQFSNCGSQMAAVTQCITNLLQDGGIPVDDVSSPPPVDASGPPGDPTAACTTGASSGSNRECGWLPGPTLPCTPGQMVVVGCVSTPGTGTECMAPLGTCTGDPVLRVCPGTAPCSGTAALRSADDTCGTCPAATVTCPASGSVYVLTGPYSSTNMGTCTPALRPLNLS